VGTTPAGAPLQPQLVIKSGSVLPCCGKWLQYAGYQPGGRRSCHLMALPPPPLRPYRLLLPAVPLLPLAQLVAILVPRTSRPVWRTTTSASSTPSRSCFLEWAQRVLV